MFFEVGRDKQAIIILRRDLNRIVSVQVGSIGESMRMISGGLRLGVCMYPLSGRHCGSLRLWSFVRLAVTRIEKNVC